MKNLPAMQEMQEASVRSLGQEDPLEEGIAAHSSILAWRSPWTEDLAGCIPHNVSFQYLLILSLCLLFLDCLNICS